MEEEKVTWAELVKASLDKLIDITGKEELDIDKAFILGLRTAMREHFDTISLARIATALYKIADLPDEITEENVI